MRNARAFVADYRRRGESLVRALTVCRACEGDMAKIEAEWRKQESEDMAKGITCEQGEKQQEAREMKEEKKRDAEEARETKETVEEPTLPRMETAAAILAGPYFAVGYRSGDRYEGPREKTKKAALDAFAAQCPNADDCDRVEVCRVVAVATRRVRFLLR